MTVLLEIREKVKQIYVKFEVLIAPLLRFLLALIVLNTVNSRLGYMSKLNNVSIVLMVSLLCSFLPTGIILVFASLFSLLHLYSLSLEVAAVGLIVYLLIYLLYLRFAPKESLVVVVTPVLMCLKVPYVIPIVMGLLGTPASGVSVGCGLIAYYFLKIVSDNSATINAMDSAEAIAKLKIVIDGLLGNKEMLVMIAAFAVTIIIVYFIRRLSLDHSWAIAIGAGVVLDPVLLLVGDLAYSVDLSIGSVILGSLLAAVAGLVLMFFRFLVDFSRTERVQFEDDEYYYYVKAVPKMNLGASAKTVTRINHSHDTKRTRVQYVDNGVPEEDYGSDGYYEEDYSYSENYEDSYEEGAEGYDESYGAPGMNVGFDFGAEENEYPINYTNGNKGSTTKRY